MTVWQYLGATILAAPLVGIALWIAREDGWREVAILFGGTVAIVAVIGLGTALLTGDLP